VGQELIVLLIAAIALAFCCFMARRGVTTDPWRVRVDRHGVGMRSCTEAVDSLILAGGGQLSIPGYAGTPPAQLLARMRKVGLVGDEGSMSTSYRARREPNAGRRKERPSSIGPIESLTLCDHDSRVCCPD